LIVPATAVRPATESEPVEIVIQTESWKDYKAVIKEIDDRYEEFI